MAEYVPQTQRQGGEAEPQSIPNNNEKFMKMLQNEASRIHVQDEFEKNELSFNLEDQKTKYLKVDKRAQNKIIQDLGEQASNIVFHDSQRRNMADAMLDVSSFGENPYDRLGKENANFFSKIIRSDIQPTNRNGVLGYINPEDDNFMSSEEINSVLSSKQVDTSSQEAIKALLDDTVKQAGEIQSSEDATFNYQKEFSNIKNKVIETGNLYSLANDKIFGSRTFKQDLESAIQKGTYVDMGISNDQVKDPTPKDGKITEADARNISEELMKDENMLKDYLAEYYTKALEQNFNNNLSPKVRRNQKVNQTTPQAIAYKPGMEL
mgnify:CR=1 FL=1